MPETPVAKHESGPGMVKTVNQAKGAKSVLFRTLKNDSCRDEG